MKRVTMPAFALGATVVLGFYWTVARPWHLTWGATAEEVAGSLPGDEQVANATYISNRVITVDGQVVERSEKPFDTGSEHRFEVDGHPCILRIRHQLIGYEYELWVDGKLV